MSMELNQYTGKIEAENLRFLGYDALPLCYRELSCLLGNNEIYV